MKTALVFALILASSPALAVNKCVIDGKTVYQQATCVGESKAIEGNVSSVGSQYLRDKITEKQAIEDVMQRDAIIERDQNNLRRRFGVKY